MSKRNNHLLREERVANRRRIRPVDRMEVAQSVAAALHPDMPAMVPDCESVEFTLRGDIERAHGQALVMNANQHICPTRDCVLADWECAVVNDAQNSFGDEDWEAYDAMLLEMDREDQIRRDAEHDAAYGGYDAPYSEDDADAEDTHHWIPYCSSMEEVREVFGGTDFIIIHKFRENA